MKTKISRKNLNSFTLAEVLVTLSITLEYLDGCAGEYYDFLSICE
jgi:hypothetical protein